MVNNRIATTLFLIFCASMNVKAAQPRVDQLDPWPQRHGAKGKAGTAEKRDGPFLPTGTLLRATLTNAIFSYNIDTPVIAELDEEGAFGGKTVFPRRTRLLGKALVLKSHDRVNLAFERAVLPDGKEIEFNGIGLSPDGSSGVVGKAERQKDSIVASAALKGAVMGTASIAAQAANPVAAQASQSVADETVKEIDLSSQNIDTSIWVPAFTRCLIYLSRRVEIEPLPTNEATHEPKH